MPKAKITKEMIVDAAFDVVRSIGIENVNARTVSEKLNCFTQPVMYYFATIEDMKRAAYQKTGDFHTGYLLADIDSEKNVLLSIGLNYIRFAIKEPNLFRFLFQSGFASEGSLLEMVDSEELAPVLSAMRGAMGMTMEQTKNVFTTIAMFAHGYASIIANNSLEFDEEIAATDLTRAYRGAVLAAREENT